MTLAFPAGPSGVPLRCLAQPENRPEQGIPARQAIVLQLLPPSGHPL